MIDKPVISTNNEENEGGEWTDARQNWWEPECILQSAIWTSATPKSSHGGGDWSGGSEGSSKAALQVVVR